MYDLSLEVRTLFLHSVKKYTIGCYLYSFLFECKVPPFLAKPYLKWPKIHKKSKGCYQFRLCLTHEQFFVKTSYKKGRLIKMRQP
jgi:hypothetical protein